MKTQKQLTNLIARWGYSAYLHAIHKHPFFCDKICSEEVSWGKLAVDIKKQIQFNAKEKTGNCKAEDILDAEMAEVYEAVSNGDYYQARMELLDAFAVLMRMDDMLRALDGKDALLPLDFPAAEPSDFVQLVKEMRAMQRAYFRTREASTLQASKRLESEVDRKIADMEQEEEHA